jgi:hypothetical protein
MSDEAALINAKKNLEAAIEKGDAIVKEINRVVPIYAVALAERLMNNAVTSKPDYTKSLGETVLRQLKGKFRAALAKIPQDSQRMLQSIPWAHRQPLPGEYDYSAFSTLEEKTKSALENCFRDLIGGVGILLIEYRYENVNEPFPTWEFIPGASARYRIGLPYIFSHEYHELLNKYHNFINGDFQKSAIALTKANREKIEAEAKSLWEKA